MKNGGTTRVEIVTRGISNSMGASLMLDHIDTIVVVHEH